MDEKQTPQVIPTAPENQPPTVSAPASVGQGSGARLPRSYIIGFGLLGVLAAVLVIAVIVGKGHQHNSANSMAANTAKPSQDSPAASPKPVAQSLLDPATGKTVELSADKYYNVTVGTTSFYGPLSKINDEFIRMNPTAYFQDADHQTLAYTGSELHSPEPATYIRLSNITGFKEVTDQTLLNTLKAAAHPVADDAYPSATINAYLAPNEMHAFFFKDGRTFYAKTDTLDGTFLANVDRVYELNTQKTTTTTGQSTTSISLVVAKPVDYVKRTASDLLYWQNMSDSGQISRAAAAYERQNP